MCCNEHLSEWRERRIKHSTAHTRMTDLFLLISCFIQPFSWFVCSSSNRAAAHAQAQDDHFRFNAIRNRSASSRANKFQVYLYSRTENGHYFPRPGSSPVYEKWEYAFAIFIIGCNSVWKKQTPSNRSLDFLWQKVRPNGNTWFSANHIGHDRTTASTIYMCRYDEEMIYESFVWCVEPGVCRFSAFCMIHIHSLQRIPNSFDLFHRFGLQSIYREIYQSLSVSSTTKESTSEKIFVKFLSRTRRKWRNEAARCVLRCRTANNWSRQKSQRRNEETQHIITRRNVEYKTS